MESFIDSLLIHGARVAEALACNARGDGFAPHLRSYFRDLLLEPIQSVSQRLEMVHVALRKLTVTSNVGGKVPFYHDGLL